MRFLGMWRSREIFFIHRCTGTVDSVNVAQILGWPSETHSHRRMLVRAVGSFSRWLVYLRRRQAANRILLSAGTASSSTISKTGTGAVLLWTACRRICGMFWKNESLGLPQEITIVAECRDQWQIEIFTLLAKGLNVQHFIGLALLLLLELRLITFFLLFLLTLFVFAVVQTYL